MTHPAASQSDTRSYLRMISGSNPKLELQPRDRVEIVRKIRTLENYLGVISKIKYGTANYIVGGGHRPLPITDDEDFNQEVMRQWEEWAENPSVCDRAGKNTVYDMQNSLSAEDMGAGEGFLLPQKTSKGFPQLLMVDPLLVGSPAFSRDKNVRDGVRLDKAGKIMGYHIRTDGGGGDQFSYSRKTQFLRRNQVFHYCDFRRAHQVRGRSPLHACANHFHDLIDLIALEIQATKTHQSAALHIKKKTDSTLSIEDGFDSVEEATATENGQTHTKTAGKAGVAGATVYEDEDIDEIKLLTSNRPNVSLGPFTEIILRQCSAASLFPYEFLCDMSNIGGAPARYVLADAYKTIVAKQRRMTRQINFPVYRWWLANMIKLGRIKNPPERWWKVRFTYPEKLTMDIKHDGRQMLELLHGGQILEEEIFEAQGKSRKDHVRKRVLELKDVRDECEKEDIDPAWYYQQFFNKSNQEEKPS